LDVRNCVKECDESGCIGKRCFPNCKISADEVPVIGPPWGMLEPLYARWKKAHCKSNCHYYCMLDREKDRELLNNEPEKYHGRWPFKRIYGIQVCFLITHSFYTSFQFKHKLSTVVILLLSNQT